jgi:hypothetical protein
MVRVPKLEEMTARKLAETATKDSLIGFYLPEYN